MVYSSSSSTSSSSSSSNFITLTSEAFTVWMKSLIFNGKGCTVYNSRGDIVYRIDNYNHKYNHNEVCLMDCHGKVLVTILKKRCGVLRLWEGYKLKEGKPWFQVRLNPCRILKGYSVYEVVVNDIDHKGEQYMYHIEGSASNSTTNYKIINQVGGLVAEIKRKQLKSGMVLGEDVMSLVVEPNVDHSLIISLVVVYSLIHHKM